MDFGGDGEVNSEEFMVFMLVTLGKVDQEDIEEIQALFHKLDVDNGGCLNMEDICLKAFGDDEARNGGRSSSPQSRRPTDKNV
jgi:Ca2+-binding EF-hand superfamily protein